VTQTFLVDASAGTILVISLDILTHKWLERLSEAEKKASQRLEEAKHAIERAESAQDYKYAWYDYLHVPRPGQFGGIPNLTDADDDEE
jgi:hypothetical protein